MTSSRTDAPLAYPDGLPSSMAQAKTLTELLVQRARETPAGEAYRAFDEASQQWESLNWAQTAQRVEHWCRALLACNLPAGARVAILLPNGLDAMSIDQAALRCGYVPVPLHAIDNAGSVAYILNNAQASILFVANQLAWSKVCAVGQPLPHLGKVIVAPQGKDTAGAGLAPMEMNSSAPEVAALLQIPVVHRQQWLEQADSQTALPAPPFPEDLAAIVYTSGTTGKPKGVMLTHTNVVSDIHAVMQRLHAFPQDVFLSFLPLSHTFERTCGYYLAIATGSCVAYSRSVAQLAEDLKIVRPTILVSVPRIYERVYAKVMETLSPSKFKLQLFEAAEASGWERFCAQNKINAPADQTEVKGWMGVLPWFVFNSLVAKPLLAQFGGRLRIAVSGGAPLPAHIARCFLGLGLPMIQGYGMTETAPVISANSLDENHPSTVGEALPGIQVRIGENNELQVHGPTVMRGYWDRPEDTAKAFTEDGWLRTGDQAVIESGRIRIMGRIKEIIVTSTGEKIPPADLEQAILQDSLFSQAFVVGEDKPYIAAVAAVALGEWREMAQRLGLDANDPESLNHSAARREALTRIQKVTSSFASYAVPRAIFLTTEAWTIENGLMTPTLKLKRNNLMARYANEIEQLYDKNADKWKNRAQE